MTDIKMGHILNFDMPFHINLPIILGFVEKHELFSVHPKGFGHFQWYVHFYRDPWLYGSPKGTIV